MRIAVCIKQVPDTADLRLDPRTNTLIREGIAAIMNPLDEFPLEAALRLRELHGGTVTAFTMGPPQAADVLHKAIAIGADQGVLVSDRAFAGADTWATSLTLAKAIQHEGEFDLIMCGKQAIDGDTAQVGPGIAAHLNFPQVTYVTAVLRCDSNAVQVRRMLENGAVDLEVPLPAVLTILKEANEVRLPTLAGRIRAYREGTTTIAADALALADSDVGLDGSPTRVVEITIPQSARQHVKLQGPPSQVATQLFDELTKRGIS